MSVNNTLEERGSRYGKFADHAVIAQGIQDTMRKAPKWDQLDADMKQALSVIADKIARILNGDPFYGDNWHDIQGYSKLIEDRINMISDEPESLYEEPSETPDATWVTNTGSPTKPEDNAVVWTDPNFTGCAVAQPTDHIVMNTII